MFRGSDPLVIPDVHEVCEEEGSKVIDSSVRLSSVIVSAITSSALALSSVLPASLPFFP